MAENYINLSNNESLFEYELWGDHYTQRMIPHSSIKLLFLMYMPSKGPWNK